MHGDDSHDLIRVQGACVNNLKNVSVEIPMRRLTVFHAHLRLGQEFTRARESLHLLTSLKARGGSQPHPLVGDLPEEHCTFLKVTKAKGLEDLGS